MTSLEFWTIASANGIIMSHEQIQCLERYVGELIYWNEKINMISRKDIENIWERHILHSLSALKYIEIKKSQRCLDIGTGGGMPGLPLAVLNPETHFLLVDSIAKKAKTVEMFAQHTALRHLKTKNARAEELPKEMYKTIDYVFSRGVAKIEKIAEWAQKFLKPNGKIVLYKGGELFAEKSEAADKFPTIKFTEIPIDMFGSDWFKNEEKKLIICEFK